MFPAGPAGFGLLILRVCASAMLVRNVILAPTPALPWWTTLTSLVLGVALGIGLYTPIACIASGILQIAVLTWVVRGGLFEVISSMSITLSLLLLGPGSFSVDGRLFGRRRIHLSNSQ